MQTTSGAGGICSMKGFLSLCAVLSGTILFFSCSPVKHLTITCEPSTAQIYVDGIYQGVGIVKYDVPKGQTYIEISSSEDGVNFASRRFYVRSMDNVINFRIAEYLRYSSGAPTFNN